MPCKVLQAFLAHGRADAALGLLRQRPPAAALEEAEVGLTVWLESGLLGEAYLEVRRHLAAVQSAPERAAHAAALVGHLLRWGAEQQALHVVIRLPFDPVEEKVGRGKGGAARLGGSMGTHAGPPCLRP